MVLARRRRGSRHPLHASIQPCARRDARPGVAALVSRRPAELRRQLPRSPPRRRARRQACHHLGGRRWHQPHADLRGADGGGQPPRQRPEGAGDPCGRSRRHLPADVARGRHRHPRRRAHWRDLHAVLLGLRRPGRRLTPSRFGGQGADHGRRLLSPGPGCEDEGDRRRGRGILAQRRARHRLPPARPRHPVERGARRLVARDHRRPGRHMPGARGRGRPSVPHHLHVGHHRKAEGRRAHARWISPEGRARLRVLPRRRGERPALLAHRPGLADGTDADHRGTLTGRDGGAIRGRAGSSEARSPLGARRAPPHHGHGAVAHGRARAHAARAGARARPRPLLAAHAGLDRRAVESGALPLALRERGQGTHPDQQLHGGHRDLRRHPRLLPDRADQAVLVHGPDSRHGRRGLRRRRSTGARRRR